LLMERGVKTRLAVVELLPNSDVFAYGADTNDNTSISLLWMLLILFLSYEIIKLIDVQMEEDWLENLFRLRSMALTRARFPQSI